MSGLMPELNVRRKKLKMPVAALIKRSGVPRPTVFRILRGETDSIRFASVAKVAGVLGVTFGGLAIEPGELRLREAKRKARLLSRLTQGTMGLEAQAVSTELLNELEEQTVTRLLAGKGDKLWG
jgi:transcriptional regulator with XRE-family HTH domain